MTTQFPVCPAQIPPRIGRERIFRRMLESLTKTTPQSLSLVGPRYSGKSVLLADLVHNTELKNKYCCIAYWDLGHNVPRTDEEFSAQMARQLGQALVGTKDDLSKHLLSDGAGYDHLVEVFEMLEADNARILMLWDGVDRAIGSGNLTRNLWDNLLSLGRRDSLWLVTASRQKLQTLISDAASVTSEFWLLFDSQTLNPMEEEDVQAFFDSNDSIETAPGTVKEIMNWTGGIPPLVGSLLNRAIEFNQASLSPNNIKEAASQSDERCSGIIDILWSDCPAPVCDLYQFLCEAGPQPYSTLPKKVRQQLVSSGFARQEKNQLASTCRLLQEQAIGANPETGAIARMFGSEENYSQNIRGILERRLAQIPRFDERLFHLIENSIRELPNNSDLCLGTLSHIEDRAFEVIWDRELGPELTVLDDWKRDWTQNDTRLPNPIRRMMGPPEDWRIVIGDRSQQLAVLQLATGSTADFTTCHARFVTKDAYVLLNALHCFRNRSQHTGGQAIPVGIAVSGLYLCIELLSCLCQSDRAKIVTT